MVLLLLGGGAVVAYNARGLRNKNPGNLRPLPNGEKWDGQIGVDNGAGGPFVIFSSFYYGLRALARVLMNYQATYGLQTVREMINRWAPASENDTNQYVDLVAAAMGVDPDQAVAVVDNKPMLFAMMGAIVKEENGLNPFSTATLDAPVNSARLGVA